MEARPSRCLGHAPILGTRLEAASVTQLLNATHALIRGWIDQTIQLGELPAARDAAALAAMLNGFLLGISGPARDGVNRATLQAAVSEMMRA